MRPLLYIRAIWAFTSKNKAVVHFISFHDDCVQKLYYFVFSVSHSTPSRKNKSELHLLWWRCWWWRRRQHCERNAYLYYTFRDFLTSAIVNSTVIIAISLAQQEINLFQVDVRTYTSQIVLTYLMHLFRLSFNFFSALIVLMANAKGSQPNGDGIRFWLRLDVHMAIHTLSHY